MMQRRNIAMTPHHVIALLCVTAALTVSWAARSAPSPARQGVRLTLRSPP